MTDRSARPAGVHREPGLAEVVAGLVDDHYADLVAATTVRLARELGAQVRFVQVIPEDTAPERRAHLESGVFAAALNALRGRPRVRATFEYPSGDPGQVLVDRSRGALALVVGEDHLDANAVMGQVADYCRRRAGCRVVVVPHAGATPASATPKGATPAEATPAGTLVPAPEPAPEKGLEHTEKG